MEEKLLRCSSHWQFSFWSFLRYVYLNEIIFYFSVSLQVNTSISFNGNELVWRQLQICIHSMYTYVYYVGSSFNTRLYDCMNNHIGCIQPSPRQFNGEDK